jgi:uncharacterized protein
MSATERTQNRFCLFLVHYKLWVLTVILICTALFSLAATKIHSEVILAHLFPYDHPYLKLHARFSQVFGSGGSGVAIAVKVKEGDIFNKKTLSKIKSITSDIELSDGVYRVLTVSIGSYSSKVVKTLARGEIVITTLMYPEIPKNEQEMGLLKKHIFSNPAYNGILVSNDGTAALILTEMKENISYEKMFTVLRGIVKRYSDEQTSIHIVGFPMLMGWIYSLRPQILMVFALSLIAMIAVLIIIFFGNVVGMIVVMGTTLICTSIGLGFIGLSGMNFSPLLYVLAFLVASRMIGNAHQITYRYFEELESAHGDRERACYETMRTMWIPNAAAVAADVAGFSVLFIAKIVLMRHLAIIMSFWALTILLTPFLVATLCSIIPLKMKTDYWAKETSQNGWLAWIIKKMTEFSIGPSTRYITGALLIILTFFCIWQMQKLKVGDPTPGSPILWPHHTYNQDQALINKKFDASSENFVLYYEGKKETVYDPIVLKNFENFSQHMAKRLPDIYKSSSSIIDMAKMLNVTFHDGDQIWYQLPRNEEQLTGLLGYIRNTAGATLLQRFMDSSLERAQITLFFADHTSDNILRIKKAAYEFFENHPMKIPQGEFKLAGGRVGMEIGLNEEMKRAHLLIDSIVYTAIFLLCAISYWSVTAGLMLTLPLMLANGVALAYMALEGLGLSVNTLPIAAVGAGLGVDFAIYLYSRAVEEFPNQGGDWYTTIIQSACTCGKAVIFTGMTIILPIITWYIFSDMKFQAEVGLFLSIIMAVNMILTLTLHPLMIYIIKPKFISRSSHL